VQDTAQQTCAGSGRAGTHRAHRVIRGGATVSPQLLLGLAPRATA
jgi:hypothetical protein